MIPLTKEKNLQVFQYLLIPIGSLISNIIAYSAEEANIELAQQLKTNQLNMTASLIGSLNASEFLSKLGILPLSIEKICDEKAKKIIETITEIPQETKTEEIKSELTPEEVEIKEKALAAFLSSRGWKCSKKVSNKL